MQITKHTRNCCNVAVDASDIEFAIKLIAFETPGSTVFGVAILWWAKNDGYCEDWTATAGGIIICGWFNVPAGFDTKVGTTTDGGGITPPITEGSMADGRDTITGTAEGAAGVGPPGIKTRRLRGPCGMGMRDASSSSFIIWSNIGWVKLFSGAWLYGQGSLEHSPLWKALHGYSPWRRGHWSPFLQ